MITFEEMRAKYPPQSVETQQEFDIQMNRLRTAQTDLIQPLKVRSEALNKRRHEIGQQLADLNIELGRVNRERQEIREQCTWIGTIFHGLKNEVIRLNPKTVPPTARETMEQW